MERYWYISARIIGDHGIKCAGFYHMSGTYPQMDFCRSACAGMYPESSPDSLIYIDCVVRIGKEEYERNKAKDPTKEKHPDIKRDFTVIPGGLK